MATATVDLNRINPLVEIVVRAGNTAAPNALKTLREAYGDFDPAYPDVVGISTLFRAGATLDELAREGAFPHAKISFSVVGRILDELSAAGYGLVLFVTPDIVRGLPDHHSLAVTRGGMVQSTLADDAGNALLRALMVVDNPYRQRQP